MSDNRKDTGVSNQMWGGRFAEGPSAIMREINASIPFDKALWRQDITASRAHAAMLAAQGIISAEDAATGAQTLKLTPTCNEPLPPSTPRASTGWPCPSG